MQHFLEELRIGIFVSIFFCVFFGFGTFEIMAAPGDLDPTFGAGGRVTTSDFRPDPGASSFAGAVAVQPDGKIIVAGTATEPTVPINNSFIILARYNPNGSLDQTFGVGGRVTSAIAGNPVEINALALQPDGKILVGGRSFLGSPVISAPTFNFTVVRFNANGLLDTSFGAGSGFTTTDFNGGSNNDDGVYAIVVQPDGKIVAAGYARQGGARAFALARYNANGSPDNSFSGDGRLVTTFNSGQDAEAFALALQPNGKLVAAGYAFATTFDFALARYNSDGSPDATFSGDGLVTLDFDGATDQARALALDPDGRITAAGNARIGAAQPDMAIARFNANGTIDTSFHGDGKNTINFFDFGDFAYALVRQQNGKYVVGGYAVVPGIFEDRDIAVARFTASGTVDSGFGSDGKATTRFGDFIAGDFIRGLALQSDGKIVAAGGGVTQLNASTRVAVVRFIGDPAAPVPANHIFDFDGDGKTDIGIFRPGPGEWWYVRSFDGQVPVTQFGTSTDRPVPADFTGDGKTDIAVWRPSTGEWFILRSENGSFLSFPFGTSGDIPAIGDFDADGKADPGVFRPSTGEWFIMKSSGGSIVTNFGIAGDAPVPADYDGDGKTDIAIYRPSAGQWWITRSSDNSVYAFQFGTSADKPVQGDYTGDGRADPAFWRGATGEWFIIRSEDNSFYSIPFGASGDLPAPGDYDGDRKMDTAVFRPSGSTWYVNRTSAGILITNFGQVGDQPIPNVFVP